VRYIASNAQEVPRMFQLARPRSYRIYAMDLQRSDITRPYFFISFNAWHFLKRAAAFGCFFCNPRPNLPGLSW